MKSLEKTLDILKIFLDNKEEMSLSEISNLSGLNKTTVYKIVSTLVKYDYLRQKEKRGKYTLGTIYISFSGMIKKRLRFGDVAAPHLMKLSRDTDESVLFAYGDGTEKVISEDFSDISPSQSILRIIPQDGSGLPIHATGVGKIMLANMSDKQLRHYFNSKTRKRYTPNTITDINDMKNQITEVKKEGVAFDDEEFYRGVRGVAAGVKDADGKLVGALSIVAPQIRLTHARMRELATDVKKCAQEISRELGFKD
jgi:IclR family KDG regulon transcriptional repressor